MIDISDTLKNKWKENERYIQAQVILSYYVDRTSVGIFPSDTTLPKDDLYPISSLQKEEVELTLYTIDLEELIDVSTSSIPSNQMTIKVDNESGIFDEFSFNSIIKDLQNDSTIDFYITIDEDYNNKILLSSMDFVSVKTNEDLTATITCNSSFANLNKIPFRDINNDNQKGTLTNNDLLNYLNKNYKEIKEFKISNNIETSLNLSESKYETLYDVLWNIQLATENGFVVNDRLNDVKIINRRNNIVETIPRTLQIEKAKLIKENEFNKIIINNAIEEINNKQIKNLWEGVYEYLYIGGNSGKELASGNDVRTALIKVKPNTTYSIQKINNLGLGNRFIICFSNEIVNVGHIFSDDNYFNYNDVQKTLITTNEDTNYMYIYVTGEKNNIPYINVFEGNYFNDVYIENSIDVFEEFKYEFKNDLQTPFDELENTTINNLITSDKFNLSSITTEDFVCENCNLISVVSSKRYVYYTIEMINQEQIQINLTKQLPILENKLIDKLIIGKESDNYIEINNPTNIIKTNYYKDITTNFPISLKIKTKIMGLPYLELGDVVSIETDYDEKIVNITKLNYSYDGGLVCDLEGYSTDYDGLFASDILFPSDDLYPNIRI